MTENIIREKLVAFENIKFTFKQSTFEKLEKLPKTTLIISNFSLPFCQKEYFNNLWINICHSLEDGGYFLGNFLGINDEWYNKKDLIYFTIEEVKKKLKLFEIIYLNEKEYDKPTAMGVLKHWHVIEVLAKYKG